MEFGFFFKFFQPELGGFPNSPNLIHCVAEPSQVSLELIPGFRNRGDKTRGGRSKQDVWDAVSCVDVLTLDEDEDRFPKGVSTESKTTVVSFVGRLVLEDEDGEGCPEWVSTESA